MSKTLGKRLEQCLMAVGTQRRGAAALEFAILAVPFLVLVLGAMEVGYDLFVQAALSNAVSVAARSVQVGTNQGNATGKAEAQWVAAAVCPALGGLLGCGQLYVTIGHIPSGVGNNYYTYLQANPPNLNAITSSNATVCTGNPGPSQLMLLQAYYLSPTFLGMLVPNWSQASPVNPGQRVHVTYASAGFVNEFFTGGESGC